MHMRRNVLYALDKETIRVQRAFYLLLCPLRAEDEPFLFRLTQVGWKICL